MMIYDRFAESYDRKLAPLERRFLSRWRDETLALLPENSRILEIGAGTGLNFRHYPPAELAVASEPAAAMLALASAKTDSIILVRADAEDLPFNDDSFDAAFATLVFCSIPRPERAFAELRRVVRPGGRIVLLEHVRPDGIAGYVFDVLNIFTVALIEDHFNRRTAEIAASCGLEIVEVRKKVRGAVNLIVCRNKPCDIL